MYFTYNTPFILVVRISTRIAYYNISLTSLSKNSKNNIQGSSNSSSHSSDREWRNADTLFIGEISVGGVEGGMDQIPREIGIVRHADVLQNL
jgi:hypothetical protein